MEEVLVHVAVFPGLVGDFAVEQGGGGCEVEGVVGRDEHVDGGGGEGDDTDVGGGGCSGGLEEGEEAVGEEEMADVAVK